MAGDVLVPEALGVLRVVTAVTVTVAVCVGDKVPVADAEDVAVDVRDVVAVVGVDGAGGGGGRGRGFGVDVDVDVGVNAGVDNAPASVIRTERGQDVTILAPLFSPLHFVAPGVEVAALVADAVVVGVAVTEVVVVAVDAPMPARLWRPAPQDTGYRGARRLPSHEPAYETAAMAPVHSGGWPPRVVGAGVAEAGAVTADGWARVSGLEAMTAPSRGGTSVAGTRNQAVAVVVVCPHSGGQDRPPDAGAAPEAMTAPSCGDGMAVDVARDVDDVEDVAVDVVAVVAV